MRLGAASAAGLLLALLALPAGAPRAEPAAYAVDPTHSFVHFEVPHFGTSISRGRWDRTSGRITLDRAAGQGRVEITIEMASISTGVPAFDEVLRGAEVFDVAAHPRATFVGERFVFERERLREVSGTLTLRGRAQPLTLLAQRFNCYSSPLFRREVCGGDFEARVRRSDWGVGAGPAGSPPVSDEVRLLVQVEAIRQ